MVVALLSSFTQYNGNCWLNDLWKFDIETNRWTCLQESSDPEPASMEDAMGGAGRAGSFMQQRRVAPSRRFGYVSVVHEGKFVLFGGFDGTRWLNDMYVFDFATNTWTEVEARGDLPSVRSCPAWAKDDRYVYVLGKLYACFWLFGVLPVEIESHLVCFSGV